MAEVRTSDGHSTDAIGFRGGTPDRLFVLRGLGEVETVWQCGAVILWERSTVNSIRNTDAAQV